MTDSTPRWQYRFDNFKRAFLLLRQGIELRGKRELSDLEKEGIIQRFEYTMELAWKTMKDYLEAQNVLFERVTPRAVIKEAFEAKLIAHGQSWLDALDARNKMSHTYDAKEFEKVIQQIEQDYLAVLEAFYQSLLDELMNNA